MLIFFGQYLVNSFCMLQQNLILQPPADDLHVARRPFDLIRLVFEPLPIRSQNMQGMHLQAGVYATSRVNFASAALLAFPTGITQAGYYDAISKRS
jgi:hypothetical protein